MANGLVSVRERATNHRVVEIGNIDDVRGRRQATVLIQLIAEIENAAILRQPTLVRVSRVRVEGLAHHHRIRLVGHIQNRKPGLRPTPVETRATKRDLLACVRPRRIRHHLRVMYVLRVPLPHISRRRRIRIQVIHAQAIVSSTRPIQKPTDLIDHDVVRSDRARPHNRTHQSHLPGIHPGQIHHLNVIAALTHNVSVVRVGLDIPPKTVGPIDQPNQQRIPRIRKIKKRRSHPRPNDPNLKPTRSHIPPTIIGRPRPINLIQRNPSQQLHPARIIRSTQESLRPAPHHPRIQIQTPPKPSTLHRRQPIQNLRIILMRQNRPTQ